ncbi:MBL fold metallo-hydrolase [Alkalibacter mobilis]|uniref:MBL fold metallo-hydrolase n=1 Tax=Alkalibacter mobilis TaxID=2787712 RepID=UPI00189D6782|nr:MBL fold metallo-hydrolase [Alkalibacter mobilis]MBF7097787.1 MBL fold metallo-hydrolase [Alkalibacter mobilis]
MSFIDLSTTNMKDDDIAIFWLGQAGFLIKDNKNTTVVIDPYLSDCGERIRGFKRLSPKLITPQELQADVYITTHNHFDHFDYDTIPIASSNAKTQFMGPKSCVDLFLEMGIKKEKVNLLAQNKPVAHKGITIQAVFADHGALAPDAIGILLTMKDKKIYIAGDTAYRPDKIQDAIDFEPDVIILSINGKFGNLNPEEGARYANLCNAKIAIPCHFWTFIEHGGDVQSFSEEMEKHAPKCKVKFMCQGEKFIY